MFGGGIIGLAFTDAIGGDLWEFAHALWDNNFIKELSMVSIYILI